MQEKLIDPTSEVVAQTTDHVVRYSDRMLYLLSFVPDDKLAWTPSPTTRSAIRIVAHCAFTSKFFADIITSNTPEPMPSPTEFFQGLHAAEHKIDTREGVVALMKETTAELCKAIDTVNIENINSTPNSPFGPREMQFWMQQSEEHLGGHAGQLAYLQTMWGDLDDHFA